MKNFYGKVGKILLLSLLLTATGLRKTEAQTTLAAGDIAFSGYISGPSIPDDAFSFVLLKNITNNTVIKFTDFGWRPATNAFSSGSALESEITFTANAAMTAGTEITITSNTATKSGGGSAGGVVFSHTAGFLAGDAMNLTTSGDQVFAYQGSFASPVFISGIHMNVYANAPPAFNDVTTTDAANWDGAVPSANWGFTNSGKPAALTTGVNAIWIGTTGNPNSERANARFTCGPNVSTITAARAALNNPANWLTTTSAPAPGFTLPTGCFTTVLSVKLTGFSAGLKGTGAELNWKSAAELNLNHYEAERSSNGRDFISIGSVNAAGTGGTNTYNYYDAGAFSSGAKIVYYRLKSVDNDGRFSYSDIVPVKLQSKNAAVSIDRLVNPFVNSVKFTLTVNESQIVTARLLSYDGRMVYTKQLNVSKGSNAITLDDVSRINNGLYMLEVITADNQKATGRLTKQ